MGCAPRQQAPFSGLFQQCAPENLLRNDGKLAQQREKPAHKLQHHLLWSRPGTCVHTSR